MDRRFLARCRIVQSCHIGKSNAYGAAVTARCIRKYACIDCTVQRKEIYAQRPRRYIQLVVTEATVSWHPDQGFALTPSTPGCIISLISRHKTNVRESKAVE